MRNERRTLGSEKGVRKPLGASRGRRRAPILLYRRAPIALEDGSTVETYLLPRDRVVGRPVITSGSWRARRRERVA